MAVINFCTTPATFAFITFFSISSATALDWKIDRLNTSTNLSEGSGDGRVEICYKIGNRRTIGISINGDLVFWLVKGSCADVRNGQIEVSISGEGQPNDRASGSARFISAN